MTNEERDRLAVIEFEYASQTFRHGSLEDLERMAKEYENLSHAKPEMNALYVDFIERKKKNANVGTL